MLPSVVTAITVCISPEPLLNKFPDCGAPAVCRSGTDTVGPPPAPPADCVDALPDSEGFSPGDAKIPAIPVAVATPTPVKPAVVDAVMAAN